MVVASLMAFARLASRLGLLGGAATHRYAHLRAARLLMDAVPKAAADPSDSKAKRMWHGFLAGERGGEKKKRPPTSEHWLLPGESGRNRAKAHEVEERIEEDMKRIDIYITYI